MKTKIYNTSILILALVSVVFAVKGFVHPLSPAEMILDKIIYIFFVLDYLIRFFASDDKKNFAKSNIFDLIAIIPLNSSFRIFRTFRLFKLSKLFRFFKLFRVGSFLGRFLSRAKRFLDTNGFKYMLAFSFCLISASSVLMIRFEGMSFEDAVWWSFVTATTVGYGDLSPATTIGRIIAVILMISGIGLIGSLTSSITSYFMNSTPETSNSEKVEMVLILYHSLTDEEKEEFKNNI